VYVGSKLQQTSRRQLLVVGRSRKWSAMRFIVVIVKSEVGPNMKRVPSVHRVYEMLLVYSVDFGGVSPPLIPRYIASSLGA
jgi:hypothetical protein